VLACLLAKTFEVAPCEKTDDQRLKRNSRIFCNTALFFPLEEMDNMCGGPKKTSGRGKNRAMPGDKGTASCATQRRHKPQKGKSLYVQD
jgi:hypothetical protein